MVVAVQEQRDPFWITGLPRSRTAWFSVAMRGPDCDCAHELTASARDFADLKRQWLARQGNADSACGFHVARILREIVPRTLVVERPIADVLASLERLFAQPMAHLAPMLERLQDALSITHPLIKRVRFDDLNDRDAVIDAADWLVPGHGETAAELMAMNVQVTAAHLRALANLAHSHWHLKEAA